VEETGRVYTLNSAGVRASFIRRTAGQRRDRLIPGLRGCRRTVKSATSRLDWTSYQLELGDRDSSSDGRTERFSLAAAAAYWPFLFNA